MQNFPAQALCAAVLMGAFAAQAAVPTVHDTKVAALQPAATQSTGFDPFKREQFKASLAPDRSKAAAAADEEQETDTATMLLGALAIMAFMVRRRWNSGD